MGHQALRATILDLMCADTRELLQTVRTTVHAANLIHVRTCLRTLGVEPRSQASEACRIPLHYGREAQL